MELAASIILYFVLGIIGIVALVMVLISLLRLFTLTSVADSLSGALDGILHPLFKILQKGRYPIILVLLFVAGVFAYKNFDSIAKPIRFQKQYGKRYDAVVVCLKDIRNTQVAYKATYGQYTGSFDTLMNFIQKDSLVLILAQGSIDDSLLLGGGGRTLKEAEKVALERGYIVRDTSKISVLDSIFKGDVARAKNISYIPYSNGKQFEMQAGSIKTMSGVTVSVFEARAPYDTFLADLAGEDKQYSQLILNIKAEAKRLGRYEGLKVGSITEATNNEGNWEK